MKTPEEIKKGLEVCRADECHGQHTSCPYVDDELCMMHICGDALALIEHLDAKVPKWISVEERMPEHGTDVLVLTAPGTLSLGRIAWLQSISTRAWRNPVCSSTSMPDMMTRISWQSPTGCHCRNRRRRRENDPSHR